MNHDAAVNRRQVLLKSSFVAATSLISPSWAQPLKAAAGTPITIAQITDNSLGQQDVSKDFLIGSRAAWQDINSRGGIRGRAVQHLAIETDGSEASVRAAMETARDDSACIALSGCVGDPVAAQLLQMSKNKGVAMAHVAPWLQNSNVEVDDKTFPIFAGRQAQIVHAFKTLSVMGLKELGIVHSTAQDFKIYQPELEQIASDLKLKLQTFQAGGELRKLGQKLTPATPGVLLFIGGTPELSEFTQGLEKQARQRYIVCLADVNLQVLLQLGAARGTPVIKTQPVPLVTAAAAMVRNYRETMARLFDEPNTSLSLAGFIAARYTYEVLAGVTGPLTRQSALAAFQKRAPMDLGGFRVDYDGRGRSGSYVTQSMMSAAGRMIG